MNEPLFVDFSQSGRPSASCSDSGDDRRAVFVTAAACGHELHVDDADRQTADMVGLDRIRQLKQFPLGGLARRLTMVPNVSQDEGLNAALGGSTARGY
jgi:alpha-D-ribose 1-methylphosphonate 5-triphosphate synthase subunit PhnI